MSRSHSHFVYPQLGRLVRMNVVNCGCKPHYQFAFDRDGKMMTWISKKFGAPSPIDGVVKDSPRHACKHVPTTTFSNRDFNRHDVRLFWAAAFAAEPQANAAIQR